MKIRLLHLAVLVAVSTVLAGIGGVFATYWVIEDEVQDLLDDDLAAQSELLATLLANRADFDGPDLDRLVRDIFEPDQEETLWINVYEPRTGRQVSNLEHRLPPPEPGAGPVDAELHGHRWFGYQHGDGDGPVVQLLHRRDRYQEVREEVLEAVAVPALAVSTVNLLLLGGLTFLLLRPLARMAKDLEGRRADSLAPLRVATPAREIGVLRDALNRLMIDVDRVLAGERAFASDVAHELRTPLTTLKLELSSKEPDLQALSAEVDRLVALVDQLLTLARLQRSEWRESFETVDLQSLIAVHVRESQGAFEQADMTLDANLAPAQIAGDATLLDVLLRNLLRNVRRHCPPGTHAQVRLRELAGVVELRVEDDGRGMSAADRERLADGDARLDRRSQGLGLGLAICHKIVNVHRADIAFEERADGARGLVVRVRFQTLMSA